MITIIDRFAWWLARGRAIALIIALTCIAGCTQSGGDGHDHSDEGGEHAHDEATDEHAGHDHGDEEHSDEEQIIALTQAELDEFDIELATAGPQPIDITASLPGEVIMNPDTVAHVVARASGIAREVFKTIGDSVEAGEPMAVLESPALAEAKAEYLSRLREHELAQTDLARAETVYTNTKRLLEVLGDTPTLDALREFADVDLGANRNLLVSAYAELLATTAAYEREKSLFEKQIGSEAEYLEAEAAYKQAQAAYFSVRDDLAFSNARTLDQRRREAKVAEVALLAAERKLHALGLSEEEVAAVPDQSDMELARYVIDAPITGVITERHIVRGERIDDGANVFTVADLSTVWVTLTVYQKDLPIIRVGQPVRITASHDVAEASGTIAYIRPVIDESTRTTTARVVLDNADGSWLPGMFIEGTVRLEEVEANVVVPRDAVQTVDNEPVIFVQTDEGFVPTYVTLGRGDRQNVIVLEGLSPGQRYAATNTFTLKSELGRAALEHAGHVH